MIRRAGSSVRWFGLPFDRRVLDDRGRRRAARGLCSAERSSSGPACFSRDCSACHPRLPTAGSRSPHRRQTRPRGDNGRDTDIWFVALDRTSSARRRRPTRTALDQLCPAFSPDGGSLAYGRVEGSAPSTQTSGRRRRRIGTPLSSSPMWRDDGQRRRIGSRSTSVTGCRRRVPSGRPTVVSVAFGVNRTSPINPETVGRGERGPDRRARRSAASRSCRTCWRRTSSGRPMAASWPSPAGATNSSRARHSRTG